jgi:hypothetical protein
LGNVTVAGYFNTATSNQDSGADFISPESLKFIHAGTNPSGKNLLLVGYEGTGSNGSVGVFEFVPPAASSPAPAPANNEPPLAQRSISSAATREEAKAIVQSKIQEALAKDSSKVKTASQIAQTLGVSKSTLTKIAKLAPGLKTKDGKINIVKLEKFIRNNPKAADLLFGKSSGSKSLKKSAKK